MAKARRKKKTARRTDSVRGEKRKNND